MKGYKRLLAWILSAAMLLSVVSFSVYAEGDGEITGDPYTKAVFNVNNLENAVYYADTDLGDGFKLLIADSSRTVTVADMETDDNRNELVKNIDVGQGETIDFTKRLNFGGASQPSLSVAPASRAISADVAGPAKITIVTASNTAADRQLVVTDGNESLNIFEAKGYYTAPVAQTYEYTGGAGTLYFRTGITATDALFTGDVRVFYIRIEYNEPEDTGGGDTDPYTKAVFNVNNLENAIYNTDTDLGDGFKLLIADSNRTVTVADMETDDNRNELVKNIDVGQGETIDFTKRLNFGGGSQPGTSLTPASRAISVDVTGPAKITVVTASNTVADRQLVVTDGNESLNIFEAKGYETAPVAQTYEYTGGAGTLYFRTGITATDALLTGDVRVYYIRIGYNEPEDSGGTDKPDIPYTKQVFNVNNLTAGTVDINTDVGDDFTLLAGVQFNNNRFITVDNVESDFLAPITQVDVGNGEKLDFTKRLRFGGGSQPGSGTNPLPEFRAIKVNVSGSAVLTVVTTSNTAFDRVLRLSDGETVLHEFDANSYEVAPVAQTYSYAGGAGVLYFYCPADVRVYYIRLGYDESGGDTPIPTPEPPIPTPAPDVPTIVVSDVSSPKGDTVDVELSLINNPGIVTMYLDVAYDAERLKLVSVDDAKLLTDPSFGDDTNANPYKLNWDGGVLTQNIMQNGTLATVRFKVLDDAPPGLAEVTVSYPGGILDCNLANVAFAIKSGGVDVYEYLPGDVNGDGLVNAVDVALLRRYLAGWEGIEISLTAADVNKDGSVDALDVALLRRYLAGWSGIVLQ